VTLPNPAVLVEEKSTGTMVSALRLCVAFLSSALVRAALLRSSPTTKQVVTEHQGESVTKETTKSDVAKLHSHLTTLEASLEEMVAAKHGALAHSAVGPAMEMFLKALHSTLQETKDCKDPVEDMRKLEDAKAGLGELTNSLAKQQSNLMLESQAQGASVLLGELMSRQSAPMDAQLNVLNSSSFANLEVSRALLAKHDMHTALYTQAAQYLDKHGGQKIVNLASKDNAAREQRINSMVSTLEKRLKSLERTQQVGERAQKKKIAALDAEMKQTSKGEAHRMQLIKKRSERNFKKADAMRRNDIESMKVAMAAMKNGDMTALARAQAALASSVKAMQSQSGQFLHFIQLGHRLMRRDCPYCVAQCLEKCHTGGSPYAQCLGDCAEAGK